MHRVTSADVLSSSAGQATSSNPTPIHGLLPHVSEAPELGGIPGDVDDDAWDDVPLLQGNHKKHAFNVSTVEAQHGDQPTSTAWREALVSLKLAAPVTVQV